jgi:hypothetical protein
VKTHLKRIFRREETERWKNHNLMENHLYECFYNIMNGDAPDAEKFKHLQRYKARIVQLHSLQRAKVLLDTHSQDQMEGEDLSL